MAGNGKQRQFATPLKYLAVAAPIFFGPFMEYANADVQYGMNLNFISIGQNNCLKKPGVKPAVAILSNYPARRAEIKRFLQIEHASGFSTLRFFVWFTSAKIHGENVFSTASADEAISDVSEYVKDAEGAGFTRIYVGFGPIGVNSPSCRKRDWGDCFDESTLKDSENFIVALRQGLGKEQMSKIRIDLSNEGGISPYSSALVHRNYKMYLDAIVGAYLPHFPGDRTTISVQQHSLVDRLRYVTAVYARFGAHPDYLDIHIYEPNDPNLSELKSFVKAANLKIPVVVGEYPTGRIGNLPQALAALPAPTGDPQEVVLWPLADVDRGCGVDIKPPYRLDEFPGVLK